MLRSVGLNRAAQLSLIVRNNKFGNFIFGKWNCGFALNRYDRKSNNRSTFNSPSIFEHCCHNYVSHSGFGLGSEKFTPFWRKLKHIFGRLLPVLHQPALLHRRLDERREERMRVEGLGFELGVELDADEPWVVGEFDDLGQLAVGRHAGEAQAGFL